MNVISDDRLAEKLAAAAGVDAQKAKTGLQAALELMKSRINLGAGLKFRSFADISPVDSDGNPKSAKVLALPSQEAASEIAKKMKCSESEAGKFIENIIKVIRDSMLKGDKLDLDGLFSLNVVEEKAKSLTDASGKEQIVHARRVISFTTSQKMKSGLGNGLSLKFVPDPALKAQIKSLKTMSILMLVPEKDPFVRTLEYHFARAGWDVNSLISTKEALEKVEAAGGAFLSIVDSKVADSQAFMEKLKCTLATGLVPMISVHGASADPKKAAEFRVCADQMVIEPFEVKQLLDKADNELARISEEEALFRQEVRIQFPTSEEDVNRANRLAARLFEQSGLNDEGQVALSAAFRESVGNAAQHGNRHRRDKTIEVLYLLDAEKITINVTDMGQGFDHKFYTQRGSGGDALGAARERHRQGKLGGLGIMLMLKCTDRLEYNDIGNSVTLIKRLNPPA